MSVNKGIIKKIVLLCILIAIIYFFWLVRSILYPFIVGLFLAYSMNPIVCYIEVKGIKRVWAIIIVYILLFGLLIIGGSQLLTLLIKDIEGFYQELPHIVQRIDELLLTLQSHYQNSELPYSFRLSVDEALLSIENDMQYFMSQLISSIINFTKKFIGLAISPILAFYILHDWHNMQEQLLKLLPGRYRTECILFFRDVDKVLSGIIRGQLTVACIVGVFVTLGLYLLQLKFAFMIGLLAAIFDIIPYFGPIIGAAPAVMLAVLQSPWLMGKVILLFFVIQQIEGNIIHPHIIGENIGLHPITVIFFVFVGGEMGGVVGMLLGVPIAAIGKVFIRHAIKLLL